MKYSRILSMAAAVWLIHSSAAFCQGTADTTAPTPTHAAVYIELAGLLLFGNGSLNVEYMLGDHFSLRGGVGLGYLVEIAGHSYGSFGGLAMVNYITTGDDKFEVGLGASYSTPEYNPLGNINPSPSVSLAYRHQPAAGEFFYRVGLTYVYRYGTPFQVSFGRTF